jgi:hypothetical protein
VSKNWGRRERCPAHPVFFPMKDQVRCVRACTPDSHDITLLSFRHWEFHENPQKYDVTTHTIRRDIKADTDIGSISVSTVQSIESINNQSHNVRRMGGRNFSTCTR